jgi:hypothetical protein
LSSNQEAFAVGLKLIYEKAVVFVLPLMKRHKGRYIPLKVLCVKFACNVCVYTSRLELLTCHKFLLAVELSCREYPDIRSFCTLLQDLVVTGMNVFYDDISKEV